MSLVNDMLRDLETRRAPPAERAPLDGLLPADEGASVRRAGRQRLLLGLLWGALAVLAALLLARIWLANQAPPLAVVAPAAQAPAPAASTPPAVPAPAEAALPAGELPVQLLATLPQHGDGRFILQLLLDRAPSYQRSEQSGVVGLRLPQLRLSDDGPRSGRFEQGGRSLSWSLQPLGDGAELLLVGLGDGLQVLDRLEPAGERWQLWVEVPFSAASSDALDPAQLPVAGDDEAVADDYPPERGAAAVPEVRVATEDRQHAAAPASRGQPTEQLAAAPLMPVQRAPAPAAPVSRSPQVSVASHQPDPLSEARQALLAGDTERAIALLEELNLRQPDNREALRWLARAWLSAGRHERLIAALPAQLQRFPTDSELRVLLARALLQSGDGAAAVATLAERMPPLASDPAYHALLAASYQQTAQWRESAQLYRNLVQLRPTHGAWQLGLGIALEQLGERAAAAQHYRQALQGQGLDEDSRRYARERVQASGGES
ncbi:MSHA biogenesis protein MshN [Pseudomonas linyingensis]|uniref:MSHA biogenesis protein MshN n=1 Tax=Pseudomonas linyingensis TaxID=915471 RepID=A0A1H6T7S1_9PSED|nr:tetratricopeptide repeat protein [Pseudomonas linyingensis]SEI76143.1 MSHA biogenesis protein MshN [Pseudomonas linyingensis]